jgi:hypothetical protein
LHAQLFHRPDVGAVIEFTGENAVASGMARQKDYSSAFEFPGQKLIRSFSEGGFNCHPFLFGEPFDGVKSAAADDPNEMFIATLFHGLKLKA